MTVDTNQFGGILAHSSLQNCFTSVMLVGFLAWTAFFRSFHNISIGLSSAIPKCLFFLLQPSMVDWLVCLGSCCMTYLLMSLSLRMHALTLSCRNCWYNLKFIVLSMIASHSVSKAAKQPQTMTLPPRCLTAGIRFLCWNAVFDFHQTQCF